MTGLDFWNLFERRRAMSIWAPFPLQLLNFRQASAATKCDHEGDAILLISDEPVTSLRWSNKWRRFVTSVSRAVARPGQPNMRTAQNAEQHRLWLRHVVSHSFNGHPIFRDLTHVGIFAWIRRNLPDQALTEARTQLARYGTKQTTGSYHKRQIQIRQRRYLQCSKPPKFKSANAAINLT